MHSKSALVQTQIAQLGLSVVSHLDPMQVRRVVQRQQRTIAKSIRGVAAAPIRQVRLVQVNLMLIVVVG